ncbi:hypothetical protein [Butyrivibrio sp. INlla16]|uniref:hypothetical protein n=1 Tax=Butyrivibrio sp. INlla16 TaxID=1520807 RepID=UPI00088727D6|nr:hypothetical protein [Butyrivibrio sp. INlla16]SDB54296.1 hypothetical protein SAMN02910263_02757 [Butyrivibrio sp. INlla16]
MAVEELAKSNQEQAVAAWINYLNQVRLDRLVEFLGQQDINLENAMADIDKAFEEIHELIDTNRGGLKGMHGFIAEAAEVGIGNARENIKGNPDIYTWLNDNGVSDLLRGSTEIQQKFYQSDLSLGAISRHLEKYPDYLKGGAKYQIPKDQYEKIKELLSVSKEEANKMPTSDGTFSLKQWKMVHEFFEKGKITIDDVEPSALEYKEVQRNQIDTTLDEEREALKEIDAKRRVEAREAAEPSLQEGLKATAVSAAIEGGVALTSAIIKKKRSGKAIKEFSQDDWIDVFKEAGIGTVKGGIRGSSIYALTNFTATPAAVASSFVTASFGVAEQAHLYRTGELDELQFINNAELLCLDAAISALSSFVGQAVIPIPVIGAVIGNTVGSTMYKIAKDGLSQKEQQLIKEYNDEVDAFQTKMNDEYIKYVNRLREEYGLYMEILEQLYSVNVMEAFEGSAKIAQFYGVPTEEILDTKEKVAAYFLE